jgi:DNA-directed RNA polymerase beta' subunit
MKIRKISSIKLFNPDNVVTSSEIYSRRNELVMEDGMMKEARSFEDKGLFSKRIFGNLNADEEFSCECGKFTGKLYEGLTCDKCNAEVKVFQANIDKVGWIDLKGHYIIKYVSYTLLEKVIGRENLKHIVHLPNKITMQGDIDLDEIRQIQKTSPEHRFWHVGLKKFRRNYMELVDEDLITDADRKKAKESDDGRIPGILKYYHDLPGKKEEKIRSFLEGVDEVFTDKIPVISIVLRPAMRTADGLKLDELNNVYINILKNVEILNDEVNLTEIIRDITVELIQAEYFQLSTKIMDNIKSKSGLIRNQIMGTRVNFSARNIISPAKAGYKVDEIVLPYLTFLYLYKLEIVNIVSRIKGISLFEAEEVWHKASLKVDQEVYKVMKKIITDEEIGILLNRNPTISYGSMLYLRVAGIKDDYEDWTMSIHNGILSLLAGDYDGDVLNVISLKDSEMKEVFREVFSPVSLIIDSNNGKFNTALNLERDQVLGLSNLLI